MRWILTVCCVAAMCTLMPCGGCASPASAPENDFQSLSTDAEVALNMVCAVTPYAESVIGVDIAELNADGSAYPRIGMWMREFLSSSEASKDPMTAVWRAVLDAQPEYLVIGGSDFMAMPGARAGLGPYKSRTIVACSRSLGELRKQIASGMTGLTTAPHDDHQIWQAKSTLPSLMTPIDYKDGVDVYMCFVDDYTLVVGSSAQEAAAMHGAIAEPASHRLMATRWGSFIDEATLTAPIMMLREFEPANARCWLHTTKPIVATSTATHRVRAVVPSNQSLHTDLQCITTDKPAAEKYFTYISRGNPVRETSDGFESSGPATEEAEGGTLLWLMLLDAAGYVIVI